METIGAEQLKQVTGALPGPGCGVERALRVLDGILHAMLVWGEAHPDPAPPQR
ncbi:hypothetical protein AB0H83_47870 [Dactylosporangium sp. NPDC050688]|uniref:hypothetical protein n=1 Tax=Dactylosporangium sp. NPDC050688 TaxID=3157217 RepID=UPI0033F175EA